MKLPVPQSKDASDDKLVVSFDVTEDLEVFRGHFPGVPVLPGVVQLHWAVSLAREHFGFPSMPCDIRRLKFKSIIAPPATVELEVTRTGPGEARFVYSGGGNVYSQGRLVFTGPQE